MRPTLDERRRGRVSSSAARPDLGGEPLVEKAGELRLRVRRIPSGRNFNSIPARVRFASPEVTSAAGKRPEHRFAVDTSFSSKFPARRWQGGALGLAVTPSALLAIGSRGLVERALVARARRHTSLDELRLGTSEVLTGRLGFGRAIHFTSRVTDEAFAFRADATFADEEVAKESESSFGPKAWTRVWSSQLPTLEPDVARALEHLFDAFRFVREGRRINLTLELRVPPSVHARDLEIVTAIVQSSERRKTIGA